MSNANSAEGYSKELVIVPTVVESIEAVMSATYLRNRYLSQRLKVAENMVKPFFEGTRSKDLGFITWQDMVRLAEENGVSRVVKRPLSQAGISIPIESETVILIKDKDVPVRQRFTLAHEIGHLFLDDVTIKQVWAHAPVGSGEQVHDALETFCNDLASRILMPKAWITADLKDKSPVPSLMLQLANKYGVSCEAFCRRAVRILDTAYHVAEWRKETRPTGTQYLRRVWQAPARGMSRIMMETPSLQSAVGEMYKACVEAGTAAYSGEVVSGAKNESLEIRGCTVRQGQNSGMLTVTRRAKPRTEAT